MLKDVGNESGVVVVGLVRPLYSVQEQAIAQRILHLRELHLRVLRKDISVFAKEEITDPTSGVARGGGGGGGGGMGKGIRGRQNRREIINYFTNVKSRKGT